MNRLLLSFFLLTLSENLTAQRIPYINSKEQVEEFLVGIDSVMMQKYNVVNDEELLNAMHCWQAKYTRSWSYLDINRDGYRDLLVNLVEKGETQIFPIYVISDPPELRSIKNLPPNLGSKCKWFEPLTFEDSLGRLAYYNLRYGRRKTDSTLGVIFPHPVSPLHFTKDTLIYRDGILVNYSPGGANEVETLKVQYESSWSSINDSYEFYPNGTLRHKYGGDVKLYKVDSTRFSKIWTAARSLDFKSLESSYNAAVIDGSNAIISVAYSDKTVGEISLYANIGTLTTSIILWEIFWMREEEDWVLIEE